MVWTWREPPVSGTQLTQTFQWRKIRRKSQQVVDDPEPLERPFVYRAKSTGNVDVAPAGFETIHQSRGLLSPPEETGIRRASIDLGTKPNNPLGLTLLHTPSNRPIADIVFVHGLGGTSQQTWSWKRDVDLFWPGIWLPKEKNISAARIFTFGYDANFRSSKSGVLSGITDFAKDLLFSLKFGKTEESESLKFGSRPIIFVAHSMGGLVVKKACILGQQDSHYHDIASSVNAILFLSTPHRGSNLAEVVNKILSISPAFSHSPKRYMAEISQHSAALEEMNEQFRNTAPKMQIFCFYETLQTPTGPTKFMIVEKDSSILGYPGEISKPLRADHHNICKYENMNDDNYTSVRNTLQTLVLGYKDEELRSSAAQTHEDTREIERLLGLTTYLLSEEDHAFFNNRRATGTFQCFLSDKVFIDWCKDETKSSILWLNLPPASGKSTLMSFVVDSFRDQGRLVQCFYVRFADQAKRSTTTMLKNLARQLAQQLPQFREALKNLLETRPSLGNAEARAIWQIVFVSQLFNIEHTRPIYWILDALDESDSPQIFLELLSKINLSKMPIRIIISSRRSSQLSHAFSKLSKSVSVESISSHDISTDIRIFAQQELEQVPWKPALKTEVVEKILQRADGNFLWVSLVLQEIMNCHTPEAIEEAMNEIPPDMEKLYQCMESNLLKSLRRGDAAMSRKILSWAALSRHPLHVDQLVQALHPDFSSLLDPKHTIAQVCGQFAMVDRSGHVIMLHQTARDYLLASSKSDISFNSLKSHTEHAVRCLSALLGSGEFSTKTSLPDNDFLDYAATSWHYHLKSSDVSSNDLFDILVKFLSGRSVLDWIRTLACLKHTKDMVPAAQVVSKFASRRKRHDAEKSPMLHRLVDLELLEDWSVDFVRIVGKFALTLQEEPDAIYRLIPPLCPSGSIIYRQFSDADNSRKVISLSGLLNADWDDNVARIAIGHGVRAGMITCSLTHFAVATSNRNIIVSDAINFETVHVLRQEDPLVAMCFTSNGSLLATIGYRTTKIWKVEPGIELLSSMNPNGLRALAVTFSHHDTELLVGFDDSSVRTLEVENSDADWRGLTTIKSHDDFIVPGLIQSSPSSMAFNSDGSYVALASRSFPLSVWQVSTTSLVGRCSRHRTRRHMSNQDWTWVEDLCWHPSSGDVIGIYMDGFIFKWHPFNDQHHEIATNASKVECSPEGSVFITSDSDGNIKIYNFQHFSLIYQLSGEDIVTGLTISPDCRRFYNTRRYFCDVWEPNVLTRLLTEAEDSSSDSRSMAESLTTLTAAPSEAFIESRTMITTLAPLRNDNKIILGDAEGVISVYDYTTSSSAELWRSSSVMVIEHISVNDDATLFISADLGGTIAANRLTGMSESKGVVHHIDSVEVSNDSGGIFQLLIHPLESLFLVVCRDSYRLWSIPSEDGGQLISEKIVPIDRWPKFASSPSGKSQVLGFTENEVIIHLWKDLTILARVSLNEGPRSSLELASPAKAGHFQSASKVLKLFTTANKTFLIVQTASNNHQTNTKKHTRIISSSALSEVGIISKRNLVVSLPEVEIPEEVSTTIELPLDVLDNNRLVYLDKNFWLCSWHMGLAAQAKSLPPRRHFPVPRDWVDPEGLRLCALGIDAAFLYPRNGEIATIYSDVERGW